MHATSLLAPFMAPIYIFDIIIIVIIIIISGQQHRTCSSAPDKMDPHTCSHSVKVRDRLGWAVSGVALLVRARLFYDGDRNVRALATTNKLLTGAGRI